MSFRGIGRIAADLTTPLPTINDSNSNQQHSLAALGLQSGGEVVLSLVVQQPAGGAAAKAKKSVSAEALAAKARAGRETPRRTGTHTLFSEGHLDEEERGKGNRYYGGGSTFFEAAVDEPEAGADGKEEEAAAAKEEEEEEEDDDEDDEEDEEDEEVGRSSIVLI